MTAAIIAVAAAVLYLLAGWRLAVRSLPRAWAAARHEWAFDDSIRGSVKAQTVCMFLFWPVLLISRAVSGRLDHVVDAADPEALAAKVAERDRRVAELERELGMRP